MGGPAQNPSSPLLSLLFPETLPDSEAGLSAKWPKTTAPILSLNGKQLHDAQETQELRLHKTRRPF